jgi:putrescine---pyruvate transaminase
MDGRASFWNPFADMARLAGRQLMIVRGEGSTVYDDQGRAYLDAIASLWYCNVGHGRPELADAAAAQMRELAAYQTFEFYATPPVAALARRVADLCPVEDARVFFTPGGGSDAVDTAAKLARAHWNAVGKPGKRVVISRTHAYHGMNAYGTSLVGIPVLSEAYGPLVSETEQVAWDRADALAEAIDRHGADRVAAFFCEPVVGAGGVYPPPEGYLAEVERICRSKDVLFVVDEVITGFGRLGRWFASERYELSPDMIVVAKGLTSGYAPLGAVIAGPRVAEPFWNGDDARVFRHGYTYSGHSTSCAVALANLDIIEREELVARVRSLETVLESALKPLADHELVSEVRSGVGLLGAVEIAEDARSDDPGLVSRLVLEARTHGVLTRALRGVALQVSPPFVVTEQEIADIAGGIAEALDASS